MKTQNKYIVTVFFIAIGLQVKIANAQIANAGLNESNGYTNAVGLRVGETSGITFKHFFDGSSYAAEGILNISPYSIGITGLYEKYISTGINGLRWYFGAGGHVNMSSGRTAYYAYYSDNRYYYYRYNYPGVGVGVDGVIGAEYKIPKTPLAISLDMKPFVEINNAPNIFFALDPGVGIKIAF